MTGDGSDLAECPQCVEGIYLPRKVTEDGTGFRAWYGCANGHEWRTSWAGETVDRNSVHVVAKS